MAGLNLRNPTMRELYRLALDQGWRVEERDGTELTWYPPDKSIPQVSTPKDPGERNRGLANTVAQLRRAGLRVPARRGMPAGGDDLALPQGIEDVSASEPLDPFIRSLADLIEEELQKRTANLERLADDLRDQVTALQNANVDLSKRLEDVEGEFEQRAEAVALEAVRKMLADRKVPK